MRVKSWGEMFSWSSILKNILRSTVQYSRTLSSHIFLEEVSPNSCCPALCHLGKGRGKIDKNNNNQQQQQHRRKHYSILIYLIFHSSHIINPF